MAQPQHCTDRVIQHCAIANSVTLIDCSRNTGLPREQLRSIVMSTSVCVSVCLSVCPRGYLRNHTHDLYQVFVHDVYGSGSVLIRRRCDTLCTFGFVDDVMFFYNGQCSRMNFATKHRLRLNLLS